MWENQEMAACGAVKGPEAVRPRKGAKNRRVCAIAGKSVETGATVEHFNIE